MGSSYLYPGVQQTLQYLTENNIQVSLLTTKVQDQAEKIIDHFNLRSYFHYLMGRRDGLAHKPSPEPLFYICNELKIGPAETLMVGILNLTFNVGLVPVQKPAVRFTVTEQKISLKKKSRIF